MKNNNTAIEQYNTLVREFNTKAMPHAPTMAQAREIVAKLLPIIEELGAMKHGTMHGRKHVWSKAYFVDTTTRKWAKFFDNKNVAAAFKEHGLCGKARPVHYSTWAWKQQVENGNALDNNVEIVSLDNNKVDTNKVEDTQVVDNDLAKFDKETGWASQGIEMTGNEVEITADELLAGLDNEVVVEQVVENDDEQTVPEQVVVEQVVENDCEQNVEQTVVEQVAKQYDYIDKVDEINEVDEITLSAQIRETVVKNESANTGMRLAKLRQYEENRLASESIWAKLRHFFFGYNDNEIAAMHAAVA